MRRLLLPLILLVLPCAGGCAQAIADRVLIPTQPADQAKSLAEERRQVGRRVGDRLKAFDYTSYDKTKLVALMVLPEKTPKGIVVCLHGLTERKEAMLTVAEAFADAGYIGVAPDLRGHGLSGGRYTSMGFHEKRDMMALLDTLAGMGCDVSRTGVLGGSLGAATALQWAGIDPRVKAVVAVAPFADLRSEMDFMYRQHGVGPIKAALLESAAQEIGRFRIEDVSPIAAVGAMDTPILLAHGKQDDIIPVTESRRLFLAARGPVVLQEVKAKHMDIRDVLGAAFLDKAVDWMDTYISAASPGQRTKALPEWASELPSRHIAVDVQISAAR